MPRFTSENAAVADDIIARYPIAKSALIPLLHLAQEQDGYLTDDAMEHIAELVGVTPAEVLGTASFYEMFKREPVGDYVVNVCTTSRACCWEARSCSTTSSTGSPSRPAAPRPTASSRSRTSSASPPAPRRPACRSTTATSTRSATTTSTS